MANTPITLATIVMNSATPDANGAIWKVHSYDGWESTEVRLELQPLTGADGFAVGDMRRGALVISLEGTCLVPTIGAAWASQAILRAACSPDVSVYFTVGETTPMKTLVYQAGPIRMKWLQRASKGFRFMVPLISPTGVKVAA